MIVCGDTRIVEDKWFLVEFQPIKMGGKGILFCE